MKKANVAYCVLFILLCSLCPILMLGGAAEQNLSKHSLAPFPSLLVDGRLNTSFPQGFDDYIADHIPYRNNLITAYHRLLSATGDIADDQVLLGKDGWLFFKETLDDYVAINRLTDRQIEQLATCFRLQSDYISERGGSFIVAIAPNKNSIYAELMPSRYGEPSPEQRNLARLQAELQRQGVAYVDWQQSLLAAKDKTVYYAEDTHWNELGAHIVYAQLLEAMQLDKQPIECNPVWTNDYKGDLLVMAFPASEGSGLKAELGGKLEYRYRRKPASMEAMSISTTSGGENTLLMHRDSFANSLIPLLSGHFAAAYYERETPFRYSKADDMQPDVMVWEVAERNIPRLLDVAPVMPAPRAENTSGLQPVAADTVRIFSESKHGLTHVYGYIDPAAMPNGQLLLRADEGEYYCPFPILESSIAEQAIDEWGQNALHSGFSCWLADAPDNITIYWKEDR